MVQKTIAFFDFDGTITNSDTMLELIKYSKGERAYRIGMIILSPYLILMKLGIVSTKSAKEKLLGYFYGGTTLEKFNDICLHFISDKLPALIRPQALKKIHEHLVNGHQVIVVSASAQNWIEKWCNNNNLSCLATKLEVTDNKLTGKLDGPNCNGEEKVTRIKCKFNLSDYSTIYCYGDTKADKPMLQLASFAYYKPFRN